MLTLLVSIAFAVPTPLTPDDAIPSPAHWSISHPWLMDGDFNGDSRPDILYRAYAPTPGLLDEDVLLITSDGQRLQPTVLQQFRDFTPIGMLPDVDGDGDDEVVMSHDTLFQTLYVPGSPGGLRIATATPLLTYGRPANKAHLLGDVDQDGLPDIGLTIGVPYRDQHLGGTFYNYYNMAIHRGTSTGFSSATSLDARGLGVQEVVRADVDGDGWTDTVMAGVERLYQGTGQLLVAWGGPNGVSGPLDSWGDAETCGRSVASLGDLDGDGDDEVVFLCTTHSQMGRLLLLEGARGHLSASTWLPATRLGDTIHLEAGDFDGDGHRDLVLGSGDINLLSGRILIYTGLDPHQTPAATWSYDETAVSARVGEALAVADLDLDGREDVMTINASTTNVNGSYGELLVWYGR